MKLPGVPLLEMPAAVRSAHALPVADAIGELLAAVHALPIERMAQIIEIDDQPLAGWRADAAASYAAVAGTVPPRHQRPIGDFLEAEPPAAGYSRVFSHNDLGIEHILVDPVGCSVTGIIDWGDAAIDDPAYDFGLLYRDLGPAALEAALQRYPAAADASEGLQARAHFYAKCSALEDLAYGIERGKPAYLEKSLAALAWLFPA